MAIKQPGDSYRAMQAGIQGWREQKDTECKKDQNGILLDKKASWKPNFEGQRAQRLNKEEKDLSLKITVSVKAEPDIEERRMVGG